MNNNNNNNNNLRRLLWKKASKEQEQFVQSLKQLSAEDVIEQAYELIMREDILIAFEYELEHPILDINQVEELLKLEHPLSACYDEWQKNEITYIDRIQETIYQYSQKLIKNNN